METQMRERRPAGRPAGAGLKEFLFGGYRQGALPHGVKSVKIIPHWFRKGDKYESAELLWFSYSNRLFDLDKALMLIKRNLGCCGLSINVTMEDNSIFALHISKKSENWPGYEHYTQIERKNMTVTLDVWGKKILTEVLPECIVEGLI
ncbi:MAG: hypothetical protein QW112_03885 [Candidatus Micrarchaeia archaeon]